MNTTSPLSAVNERLSLALESSQQIAFDWHIRNDTLHFVGPLADRFKDVLPDTTKIWSSRDLPAIIHQDDEMNFRTRLHLALKGMDSGDSGLYKTELRLKDARLGWRWVDICGRVVERDRNGWAERMVGTFSDIDERKRKESTAVRLQGLYIASSQINQTIVRVNDRSDLFAEICRIVVEQGGFQSAWIGLVDHGTARLVPTAAYGVEVQPPFFLAHDQDEDIPGFSPYDSKPYVCNDCSTALAPRGAHQILRHGVGQSTAIFPLKAGGRTLGMLALWAHEKEVFDIPLIALLEEMTRDISFAFARHEHEVQRMAIEAALMDSEHFKSAILTAALDCIISINRQGEIISFNQAAEHTFGHRRHDVLGKNLADVIIPQASRDLDRQIFERYLATSESMIPNKRIELMAVRSDGTSFPVELGVIPLQVRHQLVFTAFLRDISGLKQSQAPTGDVNRYHRLLELSPEAILVCQASKLAFLNRAAVTLLGAQEPEELLGMDLFDFVHVDYQWLLRERVTPFAENAIPAPFTEQVWHRCDGNRFQAEVGTTAMMYDGTPSVQLVVRDITERKRAETLQLGQNRILKMVASGVALPDILNELALFAEAQSSRAVCVIRRLDSTASRFIECAAPSLPAPYLCEFGEEKTGLCNDSCGIAAFRAEPVMVTDIETDPLWSDRCKLALEHGLKACTSWPILGKNRKVLGTFALYFREEMSPNEAELQLFGICTHLASIAIESRTSEQKIRYLAHYDGLTSLPNRFLFDEYLELALRNAQRHGNRFAVLFLDLDKFKEVNDTLGHDAGDAVLQEIARRLRNCLRSTDKIARMGGDEFYVLIEELGNACHAAEVAQKLLEEARRPVWVDDRECSLGASIGISVYPDDGASAQTLLKNADSAMYRAKESGKNAYRFHPPPKKSDAGPLSLHRSVRPPLQHMMRTAKIVGTTSNRIPQRAYEELQTK